MKLEQQCTSLEIFKRLKELGVKQESLWCWAYEWDLNEERTGEKTIEARFFIEHCDHKKNIIYSAFTVAEIREMLPRFSHNKNPHILQIFKDCNKWFVGYGRLNK